MVGNMEHANGGGGGNEADGAPMKEEVRGRRVGRRVGRIV